MEKIVPTKQQPTIPQNVTGDALKKAIFLIVTIQEGQKNLKKVKSFLSGVSALQRAIGFRDPAAQLTCVTGIGRKAWDLLFGAPRPHHLEVFKEIKGAKHTAPATPGDLLFHIRSDRQDLCFDFALQILKALGDSVKVEHEIHGFRYHDDRDLLGFVDGTENPATKKDRKVAVVVDEEQDAEFAGGSYVITQKYLHDLEGWEKLKVEHQEKIIGRTKLEDIELPEDQKLSVDGKPSCAHNSLNSIEVDGVEMDILRDNMPFGNVSEKEFGTFFIGYAAQPAVTLQMLHNMFIGRPEGNYDHILDYSVAKSGNLFFCPTQTFLDEIED
ncbi:Dyp-type peroxidase [Acetobacteraceae bacterium]|nr:Dyp-type peroxidase [Acetobacteraceae bacterium]